jgi:hypothetical protein
MKTLWWLAASATLNLILGAVCFAQNYTQKNLVSNTAGVVPVTDPQLINAWGLSRGSGSAWWVSDRGSGFSTLYNGAGAKQSLIVTIPPADPAKTPTGHLPAPSSTDAKPISCSHQATQQYFSSLRLMGRLSHGTQMWP